MKTKESRASKDHLKTWFQLVIMSQHHSIFQYYLPSNIYDEISFHVQEFIKIYFSNLDVNLLMVLLRKWMHSKFSYT